MPDSLLAKPRTDFCLPPEKVLECFIKDKKNTKGLTTRSEVCPQAAPTQAEESPVAHGAAIVRDHVHKSSRSWTQGTQDAVRGDRLEAFITVALTCGLREGEALALRWSDVDLEGGSVSIQRTLERIDREWHFSEPKTKRSRRTIPLPSPVAQALREYRARQTEERLKLGSDWQGEYWGQLVFTNERGGPLHESTVLHHFQRMLKKAGLPKMRVHGLRHGAASLMATLGVPPE